MMVLCSGCMVCCVCVDGAYVVCIVCFGCSIDSVVCAGLNTIFRNLGRKIMYNPNMQDTIANAIAI